jgi:hypothetical protein
VNTDTDYRIGEWQHLAFTWEPVTDNGDPSGNGNNQWEGILTAYVNGVAVNTNSAALYAANLQTPEDSSVAADLGIGSYNAKSGLGSNPFEGNVDEFAVYGDYLLKPEQVLAHYQAGTNAHPAIPYENLVITAPFTGPERKGPATYLRFNEGAVSPLANDGALSDNADGHGVLATTTAAGPRPPAFKGFEADNSALDLAKAEMIRDWIARDMAAAGFWGAADAELVRHFFHDLGRAGYAFPPWLETAESKNFAKACERAAPPHHCQPLGPAVVEPLRMLPSVELFTAADIAAASGAAI